jgi:hypothetical protein
MISQRTRLQLESLETRLTPSVDANSAFVASLYRGLLGRNVDNAGLLFWTNQLRSTSREQVVLGIENSGEFVSRELQLFYKTLLGRNVDQAGLNFFGRQLQSGVPVQQVKAEIIGSDEFFSHAGLSLPGFLSAAFRDELGRSLTPADLAFFAGTPNNVPGRTATALEILNSVESNQVKVTGMFQQILGRFPDAAGLSFWESQFRSGASDAVVVAGIAGSSEFFVTLQPFASLSGLFVPDAVAAQFIASRGLFNGILPGVEQLAGNLRTDISLIIQPLPPAMNAAVSGNTAVAVFQGGAFAPATALATVSPTPTPTPIYYGATTIYQMTVTPTAFITGPTPLVVTTSPSFQSAAATPTTFIAAPAPVLVTTSPSFQFMSGRTTFFTIF